MFNKSGFDTIISKSTSISEGVITLPIGSTLQVDGTLLSTEIACTTMHASDKEITKLTNKTKLVLNGKIYSPTLSLNLPIVEVSGELCCNEIRVEGLLTIKSTAKVTASVIKYRELKLEHGAVISAKLEHLDYISDGETV